MSHSALLRRRSALLLRVLHLGASVKTRLFAIGLAVISAALVACGGGGGSSGGGGTPPTAPPTTGPTPTPTPTNNPYGCVGQPPFTNSAERRTMSAPRPI